MDRLFERAWEGVLLTIFAVGLTLGILWASVLGFAVLLTAWSLWVEAFGGGFETLFRGSGQVLAALGIVLVVRYANRARSRLTRLFFGARTRLP